MMKPKIATICMLFTSQTRLKFVRLVVACLFGLAPACVWAQHAKSVPLSQVGVDVVSLKSGKSVRGAILKYDANGSVTMALSREWLKQANPELLTTLSADEASAQQTAWEELRNRLTKLLATPGESRRLVFFMERELERIEKLLARAEPPESPQFAWFEAKREAINSLRLDTPELCSLLEIQPGLGDRCDLNSRTKCTGHALLCALATLRHSRE